MPWSPFGSGDVGGQRGENLRPGRQVFLQQAGRFFQRTSEGDGHRRERKRGQSGKFDLGLVFRGFQHIRTSSSSCFFFFFFWVRNICLCPHHPHWVATSTATRHGGTHRGNRLLRATAAHAHWEKKTHTAGGTGWPRWRDMMVACARTSRPTRSDTYESEETLKKLRKSSFTGKSSFQGAMLSTSMECEWQVDMCGE